jgi:hypothetical protein
VARRLRGGRDLRQALGAQPRLPAAGHPALLQRFGADRLQLEVTGRNLLVLTNYSGNDPEARSGANTRVDNMTYPFYRTVTTAVNIAF